MSTCKWDREAGDYLNDGEPCKYDEHGDPTYHCQARRSCAQHVGRGELTCARCLGRVRQDIRAIAELATLMPVEALSNGVDSEAVNLAGPAADVEAWSWRKIAARGGGPWHVSMPCNLDHVHRRCQAEDDDDWHPYTVLTRWEFMVREDYADRRDDPTSITSAAEYLDRRLNKIAQDDEQDFPLMRREMRACRSHLEAVLHNSSRLERGAPCPDCGSALTPVFVRLQRKYGHWCWDEGCELIHYADDSGDRWVCPREPKKHVWTEAAYRKYVEARTA